LLQADDGTAAPSDHALEQTLYGSGGFIAQLYGAAAEGMDASKVALYRWGL